MWNFLIKNYHTLAVVLVLLVYVVETSQEPAERVGRQLGQGSVCDQTKNIGSKIDNVYCN